MRLLHVAATYLPAVRYGGTIVSVHGLCKALAARGHDVHVFTTSVDGPADSAVVHQQPVDVDGVKVWYFRSPSLRRIYWSPTLGAALNAQVAQFDVVHTHAVFLWPLWAAARAARRASVPYVVSPRGMLERDLVARRNPLLKALWLAVIERQNLEHAAAIHVTSEREANEAAAFGFHFRRVCEVPNGVEFDLDGPGPNSVAPAVSEAAGGKPFVLFLGRVNWKKGLDRLLSALARLPDQRLIIAGNDDDNYRPVLERQAERLGVTDRVTYLGAVNHSEKAALFARAQVMVVPSYSENFGNVAVEAIAAGVPVICTPEVGVAPAIANGGAGVVAAGTAEQLAGAINTLLSDAPRRKAMGEAGPPLARDRFAWPVVAAQMETLYQSVAGKHA
ncbi:MAG TPA: glycosyltransferase [Vicinamibacterales bacterium]|nr:glycosyltransferase [Vicinamibacterales bacterium]